MQGLRRNALAAQGAEGGHAGVVPALHIAFLDKLDELALGENGVGEVQTGELRLLGMIDAKGLQYPVVEVAVVDELKRAQRVGDALDGVAQRMREVVHGVDAPLLASAVVGCMPDPVERGIAHGQVGRGHVDLGAQDVAAVREFAGAHAAEEIEILVHGAVPVGALPARLLEGSAVFPDLVGRQVVDVGLAHLDELLGVGVELLEVVGGVELPVVPAAAEPADVLLDGVDVLSLLLGRVRVVEAEVAEAAKLLGDAEVQANGLGMAEVEVAVGLGGKARVHLAAEAAGGIVGNDLGADEVNVLFGRGFLRFFL